VRRKMANNFDRNDTRNFAERTRKNLRAIIALQREVDADVHPVTQLVVSLLGLITLPRECRLTEQLKPLTITDLDGTWPRFDVSKGEERSENLHDLVDRIRNAVSHGRFFFLSQSKVLHEVTIKLEDFTPSEIEKAKKESRDPVPFWCASIQADELAIFCDKLGEVL